MGRSPSGKKQADEGQKRTHDVIHGGKRRQCGQGYGSPVVPDRRTVRSVDVKGVMRALLRAAAVGALVAGIAAAARALVGRLSGEPGGAGGRGGSFDTWPVVPPAPGRLAGDGSRTVSEPGAR
jgi:hypothetical protein